MRCDISLMTQALYTMCGRLCLVFIIKVVATSPNEPIAVLVAAVGICFVVVVSLIWVRTLGDKDRSSRCVIVMGESIARLNTSRVIDAS